MNENTFLTTIGWLGSTFKSEPEVNERPGELDVYYWCKPNYADAEMIVGALLTRKGMFIHDDCPQKLWYLLHGWCTVHSIPILENVYEVKEAK